MNYRLRDWGVSRQRYWGCPIPVVYDKDQNVHVVPQADLPVALPEYSEFSGVNSPIKTDPTFYETTVPGTTDAGTRETDTFDTFFESSWYFARYCCPDADGMVDERINYWMPVDQYIGGIEHAVLHLLYSRFFHKLMRDAGLVDCNEPFTRLLTQGMVVAETFYRTEDNGQKHYYAWDEVELELDDKGRIASAKLIADGEPVTVGNIEKMSKSKNNGVDPQELVDRYGADTVRLFAMFASPPDQSLEWKDTGVEGMNRFLRRLYRAVQQWVEAGGDVPAIDAAALNDDEKALRRKTHETIKKVSDDFERRYTFNTAVAAVMELLNDIGKLKSDSAQARAVVKEGLEAIVLMLSPITPHISHALWSALGNDGAVVDQSWPAFDESAMTRDSIELVVQVNGKLRGRLEVAADADKETVEKLAIEDENVQRHIDGKTVRKVIVVPGRLINIVVG